MKNLSCFDCNKSLELCTCIEDTINMKQETVCPNYGEKENFHFNYDYTKKDTPVQDVLCNKCGTFFEIK